MASPFQLPSGSRRAAPPLGSQFRIYPLKADCLWHDRDLFSTRPNGADGLDTLPYGKREHPMTRRAVRASERGRGDWLLERGTALVLMFIVPWLGLHLNFLPGMRHARLLEWCHSPLNAIALASLIIMALLHASLGLRSILMDYISSLSLRALSLLITRILLVFSSVVGLGALWVLHTGVAP